MSLRKGSWAVAALVAAPIAADAAAVNTPSFNCDAASGGASIDWGDGLSVTPSGTFVVGDNALKCVGGIFPQGLKFSPGADEVYLKNIDSAAVVSFAETELKITTPGSTALKYESKIDVTIASPGGGKDFLGLEIDSMLGFVDVTGKVFSSVALPGASPTAPYVALDFTNPGDASLSFYDTPVAVPTPASLGLLGSGLLGLGISARRRPKKS